MDNTLPDQLGDTIARAMDELVGNGDAGLTAVAGPNGLVFLLITVLGVVMALVYVPIRLFLTVTARSRRLRLLQRIRRLRDELAQSPPPTA
ncbi:MAG: hypothetical protein VKM01_01340 [Cyanobacteriota bacterium]|nr:hypothetical protein [Cyanobacteriota bacterium]